MVKFMSFIFTSLKVLYSDMQRHKETRAIFPFTYNKRNFSCLFLTDISPYRLVLFTIGDFNLAIDILIYDDFTASTYIDSDKYRNLIKFLGIQYDPNHTFKPTDFFEYLNQNIPAVFKNRPSVEDVLFAVSRTNEIENSEQLYFCGLRRNANGANVTPENYEKTRIAFGDITAKILKQKNISTCWTDDESKRNLAEINKFLSTF